MIVEIAEIKIRPEDRDAFAQAIGRAATSLLATAKGYRRHTVLACQETPGRFVLHVEWDTLEDHTVGFRQSPAFTEWRAIIGPFFQQPPHVEHFEVVAAS